MKPHKWHKEIKAWADGAEIEYKDLHEDTGWNNCLLPSWSDGYEYRIKPQPKTPKQAWDEELTRSYKETIIERLRNDDKFYDEVFSAYDNAKDNEIKPQPKEPQCKTHPDAPHGFCRDASHSEDRYVCECEFWEEPKEPQYLYVWLDKDEDRIEFDHYPVGDVKEDAVYKYIGKIKLEVEE